MKAVLIDDEDLALKYMEYHLRSIPDVQIAGMYRDPKSGKDYILREEVDVVFLDIHMHEINGIELAEQLLANKPGINIVFVTAYDEYAIKAFELNAIDYILKPLGAERLDRTLQRIRERLSEASERISSKDGQLHLKLFQQVAIETAELRSGPLRWRTTRAKELFLYLIQHRGQLVRKAILTDMLWPEMDSYKAASHLYSTIYHIRKSLEPYGNHFQLINASEGYQLNIENVLIDVELWENRIQSLPPLSDETLQEYENLVGAYPGDYLRDSDSWWAESERTRLRTLWVKSITTMAEWCLQREKHAKAAEIYVEICKHQPYAEEGHFALMKIYAHLKNQYSVHRQYRTLKQLLMEEFNEQPSPYITEWYRQWEQSEG